MLGFIGSTLFVLILAAICQMNFELLVFDRSAINNGEYWRLVTGHFVHSSFSHGFWDVLAFSGSLFWLSMYSVRAVLLSVVTGIVVVSALLLSSLFLLEYYCGLSGILFSPLIVAAYFHAKNHKGLIGFVPLLVILTKLMIDLMTQGNVFVNTAWQAYPESHLAGAIAGLFLVAYCHFNVRSR